ncbi:hypothetical protein A6M23_11505 [Acidithiobacillus thiooxidans]|uniref:Uncharacterized protein n=3 Tax=Acidithiobacillus thiooxidans TaxID=930 RepID=A0A1C2JCL7_ACITH|nr:hypothetical protein A6M23_11505 [Acidithiobacillus thiooxidans]OCX85989.1 hypothetical protein A6P08_07025 [Acidithiobacillus thiooxidans]
MGPLNRSESPASEIGMHKMGKASMHAGSGYDLAERSLPDTDHKLLARWVQQYKISADDPMYGAYLSARVAFDGAAAAGYSLEIMKTTLASIPNKIQKAVIAGAGDIQGHVDKAFDINAIKLERAISHGLERGSSSALIALNAATKNLKDVAAAVDKNMNMAIAQKQDKVIDQWVETGADLLNSAVREAVLKQRVLTVSFILGGMLTTFVLGAELCYEYLSLTHRITPSTIIVNQGTGKLECRVSQHGANFCEIR